MTTSSVGNQQSSVCDLEMSAIDDQPLGKGDNCSGTGSSIEQLKVYVINDRVLVKHRDEESRWKHISKDQNNSSQEVSPSFSQSSSGYQPQVLQYTHDLIQKRMEDMSDSEEISDGVVSDD